MDGAIARERRARAGRAAASDSLAPIDPLVGRRFGTSLRRWFRANGRELPWRKTRDPYHILVSELMLQQTQVSRVVPKYAEFLGAFPTLHHIARARPARVTEAWSGLGYYARARNLHLLARAVTDRGRDAAATLPADAEALRALPGIGAYTAGAVSSFAYERRAELVDTNVARVLKRVFAPEVELKSGRGQKRLWAIAREILPRTGRSTWTHNQALMELGALVCTARIARCGVCPVRSVCATYARTSPRDDASATASRTSAASPAARS
ncbi:MAG: A/G-specific adenine glycosylase [Gemmatimonadaceae bacterium]